MTSDQLQAAQEAVNRCRERDNTRKIGSGVTIKLGPGDKGYLPPATEFVTIKFHNGSVTVEAEYFNKLPKHKRNKLMKY